MIYLDQMAQKWKEVWDNLQISYTDFIRTTQPDHKALVQKMLQTSYDQGDIYEGEYKGYYCVGCEAFKTEKDLIEKDGKLVCPDHLTKPDILTEKNRFFKLSKYEEQIKKFYQENKEFVVPDHRFNEVKSFVEGGLEDFSVSRETNKFGIPLPFDSKQVTYVWYDALFNYVTVAQEKWFRNDETEIIHVLGKDIVKFHAIFRPAMLMSTKQTLPTKEFVTGFFTVDGHKMSKSLGNVVDPVELVKDYDRDAVIFNLLYDVSIWADGDFSIERMKNLYESMLIGWWGNLVNRVISLSQKYEITKAVNITDIRERFKEDDNNPLLWLFEKWFDNNFIEKEYLKQAHLKRYLEDRYKIVQKANEYITKAEPWKKYKDEITKPEAIKDLQFLLYIVKNLALLSAPILVNSFKKIQEIFGNEALKKIDTNQDMDTILFKEAFDEDDFSIQLSPKIIYEKKGIIFRPKVMKIRDFLYLH